MRLTSLHIFWIGFGILMVFMLTVYLKYYRKKYVILILFIIGIISTIIGLFLFQNPNFEMKKGHGATSFFGPIIYISMYQILRYLFVRRFGIEPAYEFASFYDYKDKRGLTIADYIVYLMPFILAIVVPLIIGWK